VTVTVNGIAVEVARWPSPTVAAVRELLRQRAVALGFLAPDIVDDDEIGAGVRRHLDQHRRRRSDEHAEQSVRLAQQRRHPGIDHVHRAC